VRRSHRSVVAVLLVCLLFGAPAVLGTAAASSVSPEPPPSSGSGACPAAPFLPGTVGDNGSLLGFFQPGESAGSTCYLTSGGTLVGDVLVFVLYTPNSIGPTNVATIAVEEFELHTVQVPHPGPNGTTIEVPTIEQYNVDWSNASVSAVPGQVQEDQLTVPQVSNPENLTVGILGVTLAVTIVTPGAGIPIPSNYPQLLLHDFYLDLALVIFFIIGVGIATAIRLRARHVERMWPWGVAGLFGAFGFASWFQANYPLSLIPIGSAPEAVVALPTVFVGIYVWLAFWPTEAKEVKIRYPVADVDGGEGQVGQKFYREFNGPDGIEYIGPGGASTFQRLLGVRTLLDNRVLNQSPLRRRLAGFRSVRRDIYAEYYAWAEFPGGPKILDVVKPRTFLLPWRAKTRQKIEEYHRVALRGRVEAPAHVGFFLYVTPSRAFAAVVGAQGAVLVNSWIDGTLHASKIGVALERALNAYVQLKVTMRTKAIDYGQKWALALRTAELYPGSPVAAQMLEQLAIEMEADLMDQKNWAQYVGQRTEEQAGATFEDRRISPAERLVDEISNPVPPDLRGRARTPEDLRRRWAGQ
jgi:hypothetical protein